MKQFNKQTLQVLRDRPNDVLKDFDPDLQIDLGRIVFSEAECELKVKIRIFVRTAEGAEFQAFTWCRDEASGIARAWREGREFGHNVATVWAEAI